MCLIEQISFAQTEEYRKPVYLQNNSVQLLTTTAGNIWTIVEPKVKHRLEKVFFVGKKGWAVGFGGTILSYVEGMAKNNESSMPPKLKTRN